MYKYNKAKLGQTFSSLLKCKSPNEMIEILVPAEHRSSHSDILENMAAKALESNDLKKGISLSYIGIALALRDDHCINVYTCSAHAHQYSVKAGHETLAETIATTWPLLAYFETHYRGKPHPSLIGHTLHVLMNEGKNIEQTTNDQDVLGLVSIAMGGIVIFYERHNQMLGRPTAENPKQKVILSAVGLEQVLGLSGARDWVEKNFK